MAEKNILLQRIVIDPKIMVGKPVIKGTRLTVEHILKLLVQGLTVQEIVAQHPRLTDEDIAACLAFAVETLSNIAFVPVSANPS